MKTKRNDVLFNLAREFNLFCIGIAVVVVGVYWCGQVIESEHLQPTIARIVETVAPNLIDFLSGGSNANPTDFVNHNKH